MSDDDRDIDVDSDEGDDSDSRQQMSRQTSGSQYHSQVFIAEKRAHHNALERKRRDHIKDSFSSLRDSVPALNNEKVASRAQILKKAAEYIQYMRRKNNSHQQDIEDLKRQNNLLETQSMFLLSKCDKNEKLIHNYKFNALKTLEKAKEAGSFGDGKNSSYNETESDTSDMEGQVNQRRTKKMKFTSYH